MICPRYFRSLSTSAKRAAFTLLLPASAAIALSSCAAVNDFFYPAPVSKEGVSPAREQRRQKVVSTQYEWAVQNFEAGKYEKAVAEFRRLLPLGATLENYEMVPFYLGMSLYRLRQEPEATSQLENFLRARPADFSSQEARMALLSLYERAEQWDRVLGLAAETEGLTLFQDNRAFLKLVWARALLEKGEEKGAAAVLKDSLAYLDGKSNRLTGPDPDQDFWGRYHYTSLLLQLKGCNGREPKEINKGRKRLYLPWLEATIDCFRQSLGGLVAELLLPESAWAPVSLNLLNSNLAAFGQKVKGYQRREGSRLAERRLLEGSAREQLYRFLNKIDEQDKVIKNHGVINTNLELIRKQVDLLLVSLSNPS
jgi:hypothetical protein